jgi:peptide/nickel transport system substrate-binding protein
MYSKKEFDEHGYDWCLENAVGTGPFVMDSWTKDTKLVFSKNENYWNKEAEPYLDGIEFSVIADEMSAQAAMMSGDIDVYANGSESFQTTMEGAGFTTATNQMWYTILFLIYASDVKDSPLSDVKVRQAISYAIDSATICASVGKGKVFVSNQYAVEGTPFYNPDVKGYGYDVEKAKELLKEAGYENGFTTTIYCGVDQALTDYLVAIQGYLKEVNITLNIEEQETAIWRSKGIYDIDEGMILAGHGFGANLVNQQVSNFSKRAVSGVGMLKECKLHPDDLDQTIMASLSASNTEEMLKYEFETQKMIIDDYCLGYPVGIKSSQAYTVSSKIAENGGLSHKNEYNNYAFVHFTE